jgi:hypothetical protein
MKESPYLCSVIKRYKITESPKRGDIKKGEKRL